ncbi:hypothetical protein NSMM_190024 [Nitrosomonas mobilis]|uniref:Uncharacterized protein n=1 Tax=Nitrosomonas mobilis TaxID=51642 RepID=A0A1G5SBZ4_9PROT|nr:hypothetical protein NSMM_190024 [Nitrosomonas mobilis]
MLQSSWLEELRHINALIFSSFLKDQYFQIDGQNNSSRN